MALYDHRKKMHGHMKKDLEKSIVDISTVELGFVWQILVEIAVPRLRRLLKPTCGQNHFFINLHGKTILAR